MEAGDPGARILIVDDEAQICRLMARILSQDDHLCTPAASAAEARELLAAESFELAICDISLGAESGLDLASEIRASSPGTAILMATAKNEPALAALATDIGVYGYMVKPFSADELRIDVANALYRRRLETENRRHREQLSAIVSERTAELRSTVTELERSRRETIHRLSRAVETRDTETGSHIERIGELAGLIGERLGLDPLRVELLRIASPMHDVGKIGISDRILRKPGKLTAEEQAEMQRHTEIGYGILSGSEAEPLDLAAEIALTHHEKMDGSGYPRGLGSDEIPLEGRIAAVVDVFDALITNRVYRPAFGVDEATEIMREGRGSHFDPEPLDALLSDADTLLEVRRAVDSARS
ncbi:MAG TPA: HD domain-containing phosphohydrolase [Solirubrobacterales bacterium]|jgi:putative two-component system response regulator|nr:HD domain-containing phosphohydrolase [Solirubrobacterales bacterium]